MSEALTSRTGDSITHGTRQTSEQIERTGFARIGSAEQCDEFLSLTESIGEETLNDLL